MKELLNIALLIFVNRDYIESAVSSHTVRPCGAPGLRSWGFFMLPIRVAAFIDGFNLYHAICDLRANHLKWLDLRKLCKVFAPSPSFDLIQVNYFSAYATWKPDPYRRHREYIKALEADYVNVVLGKFKEKSKRCFSCGATWMDHEEKETDVNIALSLLDGAYRDSYDRAVIISADSDLAPAVRLVKTLFPRKSIRILTPVGRYHSLDLMNAAGGKGNATFITRMHVERSLLPEKVYTSDGTIVAIRPIEYLPPP